MQFLVKGCCKLGCNPPTARIVAILSHMNAVWATAVSDQLKGQPKKDLVWGFGWLNQHSSAALYELWQLHQLFAHQPEHVLQSQLSWSLGLAISHVITVNATRNHQCAWRPTAICHSSQAVVHLKQLSAKWAWLTTKKYSVASLCHWFQIYHI